MSPRSPFCVLLSLLVLVPLAARLPAPALASTLDFDLPGGGHFYRQANGTGGSGDTGYAITNSAGIPFWDVYQRLGGPTVLGYPASRRFQRDGFTVQVLQKTVFQWRPDTGQVAFVNVLDRLHDLGSDGWLHAFRQIPPPADTSPDTGLSWSQVEQRHWALLDTVPAIKTRYWNDPAPLDHYGLPMSVADEGASVVVRAQRAAFQYWKQDVPWAKQGDVTIVNAGDLAKEAGLFPTDAITPEQAPAPPTGQGTPPPAHPSHDWRQPGYVAVVDGQLFDPTCVPLRSIGTNVPNLLYRQGLADNLEWMRQHHLRWMRVFATGHSLGTDRAPTNAADAVKALNALLAQVQAFNAAHDPSESIYVLVSLTDYFPPGVPGDGHAYDHPTFDLSPVLPAPWYRAGVLHFDFDQEHNKGMLHNLPNYQVNYMPWVRQVVSGTVQSPALLGWQLGNELKARGSPRNGISSAQAYAWYLDFTRDVVDTIRGLDHNHLIFMGAQYIGELTDWEYRPHDTLASDRVDQYRQLVNRMLDDCDTACWNVWSLTDYDFNPYPADDAMLFGKAGVAVVATEYGFTLGSPDQMQQRFGGDRAAAVLNGLARPWTDVDGQIHQPLWGAPELLQQTGVAAIAPWGSPAPGPEAGLDTDSSRGITGAPDAPQLWLAWTHVAASLEAADRAAGPSAACLSFQSPS